MFTYDSVLVISKIFKDNISRFTLIAKKKPKKKNTLALRRKDTPCFLNGLATDDTVRNNPVSRPGGGGLIVSITIEPGTTWESALYYRELKLIYQSSF